MARRYDSSRRKTAAEQTRNRILQAALKLHWQGITEYEPLAQEAGCSLPALRKHFPTKEELYRNCTQTFADTLVLPNLDILGKITAPGQRLRESIAELCRIHESMFGYAWLGAQQRKESPTLDAEMSAYEGLADAITEIIAPKNRSRKYVIRGLLDFLTYRALRLPGKLSPEEVCEQLTTTISLLVLGHEPIGHSNTQSPTRKEGDHDY